MTTPRVLAILTMYRRRHNITESIKAILGQSIRADLIVVDNSGCRADIRYNLCGFDICDVWKFDRNAGPPCRFAPAYLLHDYDYFFWSDDDIMPGSRAIECCLATAAELKDQFATLGDYGRIFRGSEYVKRNVVRRPGSPRPVDITTTGFFMPARHIQHVLRFKWLLIDRFGDEARRLVSIHDDMLACQGIQFFTVLPTYLPAAAEPETSLRARFLDDGGGGVSARPEYLSERNRMIQMMQAVGWRSLA